DTFYLEREELKVVQLGHTDTSHTTALYVPSVGLVVSGDGVYNNTHLYLAECDEEAINGWLRALDKIEALHPTAVVVGHGVLDPDSSPRHIEETRRYLRDFLAARARTSTAMELYRAMLALHPDRVNPGSLWADQTRPSHPEPQALPPRDSYNLTATTYAPLTRVGQRRTHPGPKKPDGLSHRFGGIWFRASGSSDFQKIALSGSRR